MCLQLFSGHTHVEETSKITVDWVLPLIKGVESGYNNITNNEPTDDESGMTHVSIAMITQLFSSPCSSAYRLDIIKARRRLQ